MTLGSIYDSTAEFMAGGDGGGTSNLVDREIDELRVQYPQGNSPRFALGLLITLASIKSSVKN